MHSISFELRTFPATGFLVDIKAIYYEPDPPETISESVAVFTTFELYAFLTAVSCLSSNEIRLATATIDGTPYPVSSLVGSFIYEHDDLNLGYAFSTGLTLTNPTHTAVLVCVPQMALIII